MNAIRKTLSLWLCAVLLLSILPGIVFAGENDIPDDEALWSKYWKQYDLDHPEEEPAPSSAPDGRKSVTATTLPAMRERAEALVNYTWTPSSDIATWNGSSYQGKAYFPKGETVTGVPYTLFVYELVPISLCSLEEYRAVASINYSTTAYCYSVSATRTGPVYGSCCADLVSEVFGGDFMNGSTPRYHSVYRVRTSPYGTAYFGQKMNDIRPGDALSDTNDDHIIWVGYVTDSTITIYEQTPPAARKRVLDKAAYTNEDGYFVYNGKIYSTITRSNAYINETAIQIDADGGVPTVSSFTINYGERFDLDPGLAEKDGFALQGWQLYRPADGKWFVAGLGWFTEKELRQNGEKKHTFLPTLSMKLNDSWYMGAVVGSIPSFTFRAVWRKDYEISIDPNGGTAKAPPYCVSFGENCMLDPCYAEREGYELLGWNLFRPADGKWYVSDGGWYNAPDISENGYQKQVYPPDLCSTLDGAWLTDAFSTQIDGFRFVAIWKEIPSLTVTFDANGGDTPADTATVTAGQEYGALPVPEQEQAFFAGWYTDPAEGTLVTAFSPVTASEDHTLYAHWIPDCEGGHDWGEGIVSLEPTDLRAGIETHTCTRCGSTYDEAIPPLPHEHSYTQTTLPESCLLGGFCINRCACGLHHISDETPASGHSYADVITAPTCTEGGYTTCTCSSCGDRYVADDTEALGHSFKEGICTRCGEADPDYVPPFRFDDVQNKKAFYFKPVYWAYEATPQITKGVDAAHFGPDEGCTRGQVVTFLWRAAGCPRPKSTKTTFADVGPKAFYSKAVAWAVENQITNGTTDTTFAPDAACTRGQIVTFLWRFCGKPAPNDAGTGFPDVDAGSFCAKAVAWAVENGITKGMSDAAFEPDATCTRGQIVTFLYRAMGEQ